MIGTHQTDSKTQFALARKHFPIRTITAACLLLWLAAHLAERLTPTSLPPVTDLAAVRTQKCGEYKP